MTVIALPNTFRPESFSMRLETNERAFASPYGGSEQVLDMGNDRWMISLTLPRGPQEHAARNEAFLNALRGQVNTCNLWHMRQRAPRGTMRGAPVAWGTSAGSDTLNISANVGGVTLLAGVMIGVGDLLLQIAEDCVADGGGLLQTKLVNRLRHTVVASTPVIWDRPTAQFRKVSKASVQYFPGYAESVPIDFVEAIS